MLDYIVSPCNIVYSLYIHLSRAFFAMNSTIPFLSHRRDPHTNAHRSQLLSRRYLRRKTLHYFVSGKKPTSQYLTLNPPRFPKSRGVKFNLIIIFQSCAKTQLMHNMTGLEGIKLNLWPLNYHSVFRWLVTTSGRPQQRLNMRLTSLVYLSSMPMIILTSGEKTENFRTNL